MKSKNSVFPKFIKQYDINPDGLPRYVGCLRLEEIHTERHDYKLAQYYRDGGCWSAAFEMGEDGILIAQTPEIMKGKKAVACTYEEWKESNGKYAKLSKEEQKELGICNFTCECCKKKFKAEEKSFYCCTGYDSIGEPTCGCKGQPICPIVCSEECYKQVVRNETDISIYKQLEPIKMSVKMADYVLNHTRLQDMLKKKAHEVLGIPIEKNWYDIFQDDLIIVKSDIIAYRSISIEDDSQENGDTSVDWPKSERERILKNQRRIGKHYW